MAPWEGFLATSATFGFKGNPPILGVPNSEIVTVGAKMPKIISHFLSLDALILGAVTV